jgi:hypothetical protein
MEVLLVCSTSESSSRNCFLERIVSSACYLKPRNGICCDNKVVAARTCARRQRACRRRGTERAQKDDRHEVRGAAAKKRETWVRGAALTLEADFGKQKTYGERWK